MRAVQFRQDLYSLYDSDTPCVDVLPDPFQSTAHHHQGRHSGIPPLAYIPSRRRKSQRICWGIGPIVCWSTVFVLVMAHIFIKAASLAAAFRSREIDSEVYQLQNLLQREYARVAVATSPDTSRNIALAGGLEKVTPERVDNLTSQPVSHIASASTGRVKDTAQSTFTRRGAPGSTQHKDEARTVQIVLAPPPVAAQH